MGDPVEALWKELAVPLRGYFALHARRDVDPEDLLQECFLRVMRGIDSVRSEDRLGAWVQRIARNLVVDSLRLPNDRELPDGDLVQLAPEDDPGVIVASWIAARIDKLDEPYGEALRLFEIEGLSQADIALRLGLSTTAVKSRVRRGRDLVREDLTRCCSFEFDPRGRVVDWTRREGEDCSDC